MTYTEKSTHMDVKSYIDTIFEEEKIQYRAALSLTDCKTLRAYLLEKEGIGQTGTVFVFAVPYFCSECEVPDRNISVYAVGRDYHLFFSEFYDRILPRLRTAFPENKFGAYSDHSPIDEVGAAAMGGLGIIGKNHLLITQKYSSYVFLGEIVTDALVQTERQKIRYCENCGACERACPVDLSRCECLSALTQRKGKLTEKEEKTVIKHGSAWGCDICQMACPHTKKARESGTIYSPVPFYNENCIAHLTSDTVNNMSEAEFAARAYAWRKRETILRNLKLFEKQ